MAKRQIKNYVFKPGIGALDNLFPNAYNLIEQNRDFLLAESVAYIDQEIIDATKCRRDIGYIVDGAAWDILLGTNYNAIFLGIAETNSLDLSNTVTRTILRAKSQIAALSAVSSDATALSRNDDYFDELLNIVANGRTAASTHVYPNPTTATASKIATKTKLLANLDFITAEVNAWVNVNFPAHNHNVDKCTRDVKYAIYAAVYDSLYGGNSASYDSAKFFNNYAASGATGITAEHQAQTVAAYRYLQTFISSIVRGIAITPSAGNTQTQVVSGDNANTGDAATVASLIDIVADVVESGTGALPGSRVLPSVGWATAGLQAAQSAITANKTTMVEAVTWSPTYTYNSTKCQRDLGYVLDAYLHDLRYGGNEQLRKTIKYYWDEDVAQVDGNRIPEIDTHAFIGDLITDYIFTNTAYDEQGIEAQIIGTSNAETGAAAIIDALVTGTVNVITGGLSAMPTAVDAGVGSIKIQGRYDSEDFLLITNTTANEIIYNFANNTTGGAVEIQYYGSSDSFPTYLQTTDAITKITLNYDTSGHNETDDLQIFVEYVENGKSVVTTRPHDFGTDAIERMRIAPPLSMLDADFEYGLQPTKWSAIGTMRGYPSVYELPGTDTEVVSVTTDASLGFLVRTFSFTAGASGTSDYTISGIDRNGVISGNDPIITIREGDTITFTNSVSSTHPLYIKTVASTGTGNQVSGVTGQGTGTVTWTPNPGQAGTYFYQCSNHLSMSGQIIVLAGLVGTGVGQSLITVTTVTPHGFTAGTPITLKALENSIAGAARAEGSFIINRVPTSTTFNYFAKAKVGTSNGQILSTNYTQLRQGGFYTGASIGQPTFTIESNGSSGTMFAELNVPTGSDIIPFDGVAPEIGSPVTNVNIPLGSQVTGIRSTSAGGGEFLTPVITQSYPIGTTEVSVASAIGIEVGLAADRGDGTATFITGIDGSTLNFSSAFTKPLIAGIRSHTNVVGTNDPNIGSGAIFTVSRSAGSYTIDAITTAGINYQVGDRILISGTSLGGSTPDNDLLIRVATVNALGGILTTVVTGTAFGGDGTFTGLSGVYQHGSGVGLRMAVTFSNNVYTSVQNLSPDLSEDWVQYDRALIAGSDLGGSGTNDITVSITGVGLGGSVTTFTTNAGSKTAPNANITFNNVTYATSGAGTGATVDITMVGTTYSAVITGGINFVPTDTITVQGTNLNGSSPANNCVITITSVNGLGAPTAFTVAGTGSNTQTIFPVLAVPLNGNGATFDVTLTSGVYSVSVATGGLQYAVNQQIKIPGLAVGGTTPTNDITITVTGVNASGTISTVSLSGTGAGGSGTYTGVSGTNDDPIGSLAIFEVGRSNGTYTTVGLTSGGTNYQVGDRIILEGSDLDGASPANDILVRVTSVLGSTIDGISYTAGPAVNGSIMPLISTFTMSDETTGTISRGNSILFDALSTIRVDFVSPHGLVPGDTFFTTTTSDNGTNNHNLAAGSFIATEIPTISSLRYQARAPGTIDTSSLDITGTIYPRPDSFFVHRPFDGGVQLGTGGPQHGAQAIRQSKKYIRYQSGKGIMYTTGALFAPSYDLRSVTADGVEVNSLITVVTDDNDHGVQVGGIIRLLGVVTPGYNSGEGNSTPPWFDYEVVDVDDERTFKVRAQRRLGSTTAELGFGAQMSVVSWHGATVRSGIFDDQNGIYWEFDGTQISVAQRTGTFQCAGTIAIDRDSNAVAGTNTRFTEQLKAGDRVIIRGMTHVVSHVLSDTSLSVTPDFRGVRAVSGAKMMLVTDKKVKQSEFNLDKLDGTGPSGYDLDPAKMQMIGIQYSWYGAGFIDWMLRGSNGNFVFAHRMRNSNVNTEAFMRSGNLPVRYEVTNEGPPGQLSENITSSQTTIPLKDASFFPYSGTVYINNEIINYNGVSGNSLINCDRGATFSNFQAGATRTYTAGSADAHTRNTGVILISNTITPLISHWGSAFLTDGGFDEDRGYIFSYSETGIEVSTTKQTAFMIRLAPSVSNAIVGDLGERELLNRAQLLLQGLEVTSDGITTGASPAQITGGIIVEGVLNPNNYPLNPDSVGWSRLSGLAQGGQPSFAQIASGGSIEWSSGVAATTTTGTSIGGLTAQIDSGSSNWGFNNYINISANDYATTFGSRDRNLVLGKAISGSGIPANSVIQDVYISPTAGDNYGWFYLNNRANGLSPNSVNAYTITYNTALTNRNFAYLTKASFEASGASVGTEISAGSSLTIPANTQVNRIIPITWAGTQFYEIQFNNSYTGTLALSTGTITFRFVQPPFAQPGETVFSFIATPGERSTLELSELKELTNTPLGGRGTFPNGPDVLAINIYKVSGANTTANIIIKWGEAQA